MAKILVVDDERMICDLLRAILTQRGHDVHTTTNPREAVQLYRQHQPAITLLDIHMPAMDGIAVLLQLRTIDPKAVVIMLTGVGTDELENQARERGVTDFLRKGLSLDILVGVMDRVLAKPAVAEAPPVPPLPPSPGEHPSPGDRPAADAVGNQEGAMVLVVDDEEMVRALLQQYLTLKGYRVCTAQNGQEALAVAKRELPRMVVLDMYMPGMNGVQVLRALRAAQYRGGVVALTASQDEQLLQQTLDLGSVDVLGKPVDLERLDLVLQVGLAVTEP